MLEYCCHVWVGAPSCYLKLLDKLQKRICRTVGLSLSASLEPLTPKCSQLKSFIVVSLVDIHLRWLNWLHFLILAGGLLDHKAVRCISSPFLLPSPLLISTLSLETWKHATTSPSHTHTLLTPITGKYQILWWYTRITETENNIKPWKRITYRNCMS